MQAALGVAAHAGQDSRHRRLRPTARASFPWNRILLGELELIGSNASAGAWPEAVRLAVTRRRAARSGSSPAVYRPPPMPRPSNWPKLPGRRQGGHCSGTRYDE